MRTRRRAPVLLLLLAVATGVFAMHTLGHQSHDAPTAAGGHDAPVAMGHDGTASVKAFAASRGDNVRVIPGRPGGMPMDPTEVCLAVLTGLAVVLMALSLLARVRHAPAVPMQLASLVSGLSRGPPKAVIGLRLADLSVLRI